MQPCTHGLVLLEVLFVRPWLKVDDEPLATRVELGEELGAQYAACARDGGLGSPHEISREAEPQYLSGAVTWPRWSLGIEGFFADSSPELGRQSEQWRWLGVAESVNHFGGFKLKLTYLLIVGDGRHIGLDLVLGGCHGAARGRVLVLCFEVHIRVLT